MYEVKTTYIIFCMLFISACSGKGNEENLNRLANEQSPYLLQHANNPVDWYPWGEEAFAKAKAEDKPIFLSIGYSTCHWCHVMEHESFEDDSVAKLMNDWFVSIKAASYIHLRAHQTLRYLVCRLLLEKKKEHHL